MRASAVLVLRELEAHQATWQSWHVYAEAQRHVRDVTVPPERAAEVVHSVVDATEPLFVNLTPDRDPITEPDGLRRSDGTSVVRHTGRDHFTSARVLDAEERLVAAAGMNGAFSFDLEEVEISIRRSAIDGDRLNRGQRDLVMSMATSDSRVRLALAPGRVGQDHRAEGACAGVDRPRVRRHRTHSVGRSRRRPHRGGRDLQLDPDKARPPDHHRPVRGLGRRHRPAHADPHRRGRHGRHPHPRQGGRLLPGPRTASSTAANWPTTRGSTRRRRGPSWTAVVHWALPQSRALADARRAARQATNAGSGDIDEQGRRVDDREIAETRDVLRLLATSAMGWHRQRGRFRGDLVGEVYAAEDLTKRGLPAVSGIETESARTGRPSHTGARPSPDGCSASP